MQLPPQRPKTPPPTDALSDPEPPSPSLPEPDPGVFHPGDSTPDHPAKSSEQSASSER